VPGDVGVLRQEFAEEELAEAGAATIPGVINRTACHKARAIYWDVKQGRRQLFCPLPLRGAPRPFARSGRRALRPTARSEPCSQDDSQLSRLASLTHGLPARIMSALGRRGHAAPKEAFGF
jgi:hypothetical protein